MTVRLFTLTDCLNEFISLKSRMDNSSLIRIHWLKNNRLAGFSYFISNTSCKVLKSFFTALAVIFCIKFYTNVI